MPETDLAPTRRFRALEALGIAALALVLNLAGNGRVGLWDRDEPRYAECTREMRASGDYIQPRFNALPRYQKPVLIYWLMLAGTAIGGDNPFGARLVSAIAGAASCLLVLRFGARMFGPRIGRIAALVLATAPIVVFNAKLATTDATLALLLLACQFALWELSQRASVRAAAAFWTCLALSLLTKGPVGPAMIAAAGLVSWAVGGPSSCWKRLHWRWGIPVFLLIAAPWFVAIGIVTNWDFYRVAVGSQVIHRVTTPMEQHGGFPGYYPATTLLVFAPWSALLPAALLAGWVKRKSNPALGFLLGWAIGPMILLECVRTKLVHYYLPAYPACALLVGWLITSLADAEINLRRWPLGRVASGLLAGTGFALSVLALGGAMVLPWSLKWPCLVLALVLGGGTILAAEGFRHGRPERATFGLAGTWALALLVVGAWLLPSVEPYRFPRIIARRLAALAEREHARPVLATFQEPSLIYEMGRPTPIVRDRAWLLDLLSKDGAAVAPLSQTEMDTLVKEDVFALEVKDTVTGFNLSKGRSQTLHMVVIRPQLPALARRAK